MGSVSGTYKREEGHSPQNADPVVITLNMNDSCEVHMLAKWQGVFDLKIVQGTWMKCASNRVAKDEAMVKVTYKYNENDFEVNQSGEPPAYCTTSMYVRINTTKHTFSSIDGDDLDEGPDPYMKT